MSIRFGTYAFTDLEIRMLAHDLTEVLAGEDYQIDVDSQTVLRVLPQFLMALVQEEDDRQPKTDYEKIDLSEEIS